MKHKNIIHSPEVEAYVLKKLEDESATASVTYELDFDEGDIITGDIGIWVLTEEGERLKIGTGEIYKVHYAVVDIDYLRMAADAMSGHFEGVTYCMEKHDDDLVWEGHVYYLSEFDLYPQYQNKGYGRFLADQAIRAAGAKSCCVFIYPSKGSHVEHKSLIDFWMSLSPRAQWDEKHETIFIDSYGD